MPSNPRRDVSALQTIPHKRSTPDSDHEQRHPHHSRQKRRQTFAMSTRPSSAPSVMLTDLINNCQRMSATLPPDNCDVTTAPPAIHRREAGILSLSPAPTRRISTRRVTSAPAAAPSQFRPKKERYYSSRATEGAASPGAISESLTVEPPTPTPTSTSSLSRRRESDDSAHPSSSPTRSLPLRTADVDTPARPYTRVESSSRREYRRGHTLGAFSHSNGVHRPSPLRNVSMPGEGGREIELVARGLPRAVYELPGPREERRGRRKVWDWGCCGRRK